MEEEFAVDRMVDAHAALYRELCEFCAKPQATSVTSASPKS
jgi:hypothetical protein